jgi:hypothetical protein
MDVDDEDRILSPVAVYHTILACLEEDIHEGPSPVQPHEASRVVQDLAFDENPLLLGRSSSSSKAFHRLYLVV